MCAKLKLTSRNSAKVAARVMEKRYGGNYVAYWCGDCSGWHTGHAMGENPSPYTHARRKLGTAPRNFEPITRKRDKR